MIVYSGYGGDPIDVQATVAQMDDAVYKLRATWNQIDSQFAVLFTSEQAAAVNARLKSLKGLITDLDAGGVARQHVFFPLPGQTHDEAWQTWKETTEYVKQGLADLGGFIGKWSLGPTLARIAEEAGGEIGTAIPGWVKWTVGGVVVIFVISQITPLIFALKPRYSGRMRK